MPDLAYEYRLNGGDPSPIDESPAVIHGLDPETTYHLEIRAIDQNTGHTGDWSSVWIFATLESIAIEISRRFCYEAPLVPVFRHAVRPSECNSS